MSNNPLSASPDDIQEWECPYCDQTRQTFQELREHITESTEGDHQGVSGLKHTRDLVAYGPNGQEVERVEGVSTEPADPIGQYDKRVLIINCWLAGERNPDRKAVEKISGASQQYVSRVINELESGEIPRETWVEAIDYGLVEALEERLEDYEQQDTTMNAELQTTEDILDETPKKQQIIAAHDVAGGGASKKSVAEALDASYEYVRQIFNDIEDRDPSEWEKLREGDLDEEISTNVKEAVAERLRRAGVETGESELDELREEAYSEDMIPEGQAVPVEEIVSLRERIELLHEQAQFTDDKEAEFVAEKGLEWIDQLIKQAE
jgi:hypothetical protein